MSGKTSGRAFDPVYDHASATKTSVTTAATAITPPSNCKFVRVVSDAAILLRADGGDPADSGAAGGLWIGANAAEIVPVTGGVAVRALSLSGTAVVRCCPLKARA